MERDFAENDFMEALILLNLVPQTFHSWPFDESSEMIEHACVFKLNSMSMFSLWLLFNLHNHQVNSALNR